MNFHKVSTVMHRTVVNTDILDHLICGLMTIDMFIDT